MPSAAIGTPWRMLNTVRTITTGQVQEFSDGFTGSTISSTNWSHPSWTLFSVASTSLPTVGGDLVQVVGTKAPDLRTALLADQSVSTESYREVSLNNWFGPANGPSIVYLLLDLADSSSNPNTGGVWIAAEYSSSGASINLVVDGTQVATWSSPSRPPGPTWVTKLSIDGAGIVRAYWTSTSVPDLTYSLGTYTAAGTMVGFGLRAAGLGQVVAANSFLLRSFLESGTLPATALVGANNGIVYYELTNGTMTQVNSALRVRTDDWISSANRLDHLYIADAGVISSSNVGNAVLSVSGTTLTDAMADFTTDGVDADDDMVEITGGASATLGTYPISSITSATVLVVTGNMGTGSDISYRIVRAPKDFDSDALTLTRLTTGNAPSTKGYIPPNCNIVCVFNDRLCWAGDPDLPEAIYMSKVGTVDNYLYGTNLADQAFVYDPARVAGAPYIGDRVTALIPQLDDYLIIGCKRSIWVQRGDPALGNTPEVISREIGILKQSAWCYTPEGTIVAMTLDGLYLIAPTPSFTPQRLSRDRMPQELVNIDTDINDVLVEYDTLRNGINIFVTPRNPGSTRHFWFGWQLKEFSPESYDPDFEPTAITSHALGGVGPRRVVMGCRDGYLRVHDDAADTDDGKNYHSNVLIGPIMLGGNGYYEGMLREVVAQTAADSGQVWLRIKVGNSIEDAYLAGHKFEARLRAGKNMTLTPRIRGNACFIELYSEGGEAWAMEQLTIRREVLGKQRLLA